MQKTREDFQAALVSAAQLTMASSPDDEPYKSKYAARETLMSLRAKLVTAREETIAKVLEASGCRDAEGLPATLKVEMELGFGRLSGDAAVAEAAEYSAAIDRVDTRLGINFIETEENAEGDRVLQTLIPRLVARVFRACQLVRHRWLTTRTRRLALRGALAMTCDVIRGANFLSMIWSGWGRHAGALNRLRLVKAAHNTVLRASRTVHNDERRIDFAGAGGGATPATASESTALGSGSLPPGVCIDSHSAFAMELRPCKGTASSDAHSAGEVKRLLRSLDVAVTHTCFYMAQVYGHLSLHNHSAMYVQRTLRRQVSGYRLVGEAEPATDGDATPLDASPAAEAPSPAKSEEEHAASASAGLLESESAQQGADVDRVDWARNCLKLADYYRNRRRWAAASHCVAVARAMLAQAQRAAEAAGLAKASQPEPLPTQAEAAAASAGGEAGAEDELATHADVVAWRSEAGFRGRAESRVSWAHIHRDVLKVARDREIGRLVDADLLGPFGEEGPRLESRGRRSPRVRLCRRCERVAEAAVLAGAVHGLGAARGGVALLRGLEAAAAQAEADAARTGGAAGEGSRAGAGPGGEEEDEAFGAAHGDPAVLCAAAVAAAAAKAASAAAAASAAPAASAEDDSAEAGEAEQVPEEDSASDWEEAEGTEKERLAQGGGLSDEASLEDVAAASLDASRCFDGSETPFWDLLRRVLESEAPIAGTASKGTLAVPLSADCPASLPPAVTDFGVARPLFLVANYEYRAAMEFLVLDGFVTDHVGIQASVATLYKSLALWERNPKRACAMHQRRIAATAPLLAALNPTIYIVAHKELSMELGQAAQEAMDLRVSATEQRLQAGGAGAKVTLQEILAINVLADQAIALYNHFLRCFDISKVVAAPASGAGAALEAAATGAVSEHGIPPAPTCVADRAALIAAVNQGGVASSEPEIATTGGYAGGNLDTPLAGATDLDAGTVEAYLTAHFCIARLLGKRLDPPNAIRDAAESHIRFQWLSDHAEAVAALGAPEGTFSEELRICKEMAELLPQKVAMLKAQQAWG